MKEIKKSVKSLELDKVLNLLSKQASLDDTVMLCSELLPEFSLPLVQNLL